METHRKNLDETKPIKKAKVSVVEEVGYGIYMWKMPTGDYVGDGEGNFLSITSMSGDISRMARLKDAVRAYGVTTGQAVFLAGSRKVTDEEYQEQVERLAGGLVPDEYDIPSLIESAKSQDKGLTD